jgi:hypothetical protein
MASLLTPGQTVAVQGWLLNTSYGRVIDAQAVNAATAQTNTVAPSAHN